MKGSFLGLIWGAILSFAWRDWGKWRRPKDSLSPGWSLNPWPAEYKIGVLITQPRTKRWESPPTLTRKPAYTSRLFENDSFLQYRMFPSLRIGWCIKPYIWCSWVPSTALWKQQSNNLGLRNASVVLQNLTVTQLVKKNYILRNPKGDKRFHKIPWLFLFWAGWL